MIGDAWQWQGIARKSRGMERLRLICREEQRNRLAGRSKAKAWLRSAMKGKEMKMWHYTLDSMPPDDSAILVTTLSGEVLFARYFEKDMDFIVAVRTPNGLRAERYDPVQIMAWMELPGAYIPG